LRYLACLMLLSVFVAGCNMSAPGVARVGAPLPAGEQANTTYNSDWVNRGPADSVNGLNGEQHMSVDISERKLGTRYHMDEEARIGADGVRYNEPAHEKRQRERQEARRAVWRERMGFKTMADEEAERKGERKADSNK
jgi:hypothetical protein